MKGLKKFLLCLLAVIIALLPVGCGPADDDNGKNPGGNDGVKKKLMFQVDEGMGGYEYLAGFGYDDANIPMILEHTYEGLAPFMDEYDVSVLIYPCYYYKEAGWNEGKDVLAEPIYKLSPNFRKALDYYREKNLKLYVGIMTSNNIDNYTGVFGTLPSVNIFHGQEGKEERRVASLSLDLETIKAIADVYPEVFEGLYTHELIPTHWLYQSSPTEKHYFETHKEDIIELLNVCIEKDLYFIQEDFSWETLDNINSFWYDIYDYAQSRNMGKKFKLMSGVGEDGSIHAYFETLRSRYPSFGVGATIQAWDCLDRYRISGSKGENGYMDMEYPELNMPVELMAGRTIYAFETLDFEIVQYEPNYEFWNCERVIYIMDKMLLNNQNGIRDYVPDPSIYEKEHDFSPRLELFQLAELLTEKRFTKTSDFVDADAAKLSRNSEDNMPVLFTQNTVIDFGSEINCWDKYINDKNKILRQDYSRFGDWYLNENTAFATRIMMSRNNYDSILTAQNEADGLNLYIHNQRSGQVMKNSSILKENTLGKVVGITTANIISEKVVNCAVDPDEMIVAREKNGKVKFEIYQIKNSMTDIRQKISATVFIKIDSTLSDLYLMNLLGRTEIDLENYLGLIGIRTRNVVNFDTGLRATDGLFIATRISSGVKFQGKLHSSNISKEFSITMPGTIKNVYSGDFNMDTHMQDELIIKVTQGNDTNLMFYDFGNGDSLTKLTDSIKLDSPNNKTLVLRKAMFQFSEDIS